MAADPAPSSLARGEWAARTVIATRTARRSLRSAVLWGYVFGIVVVSSAVSYSRIYTTPAERRRLADTFGTNHAASALFGPAPRLQTVAGFTVFKSSMAVMVVGAVWGLLTSTRLLRGEEEAGRWELLVSGQTTRGRALVQALFGLGLAAGVVWAITAALTIVGGRSSSVRIGVSGGLYLAAALVASAVMFLCVGALTSQLASSRRQAAGVAGVVLSLSYGVRMVGDAVTGLHWLVWASPLGWVEELRPLTDPRPWAFAPIAGFAVVLCWSAVRLAGRRDVGGSVWTDRSSRPSHVRLLSGPSGLTLRLMRSSIVSWAASIAIAGLLMGIVAKAAGATIVGSSVHQVFSRLGAPGSGAGAFLGVAFVILAIAVAFQAVAQLAVARAEEADGRADHLLAAGAGRVRWFLGWLLVVVGSLVLSSLAAGALSWVGAAVEGSGLGIRSALAAGLNVLPPALFVLGAGALAFGLAPRAMGVVMYAVLGWSALVELVGGFVSENHWALDTSLFHQMAAAPAVATHWQADAVVVGIGLVMAALGLRALARRDLQGE